MPRPGRRRFSVIPLLGAATALFAVLGSCGDAGVGTPPPDDGLFFPSGLLLDPRAEEGAPARWLFVANANSDLVYNGASLLAIDLDAFFAAWRDPVTLGPNAEVGDITDHVSADRPCRHNPVLPQMIECMEEPFVAADKTVHVGSFTTGITAYKPQDTNDWRLLIPVRGDPSVAYVDLKTASEPELSCGRDEDARDERRCSPDARIRYLRNDPDYRTIGREPTNILITRAAGSDDPSNPPVDLAFVTHTEVPEVTLIGLGGLYEDKNVGDPAIIDIQALFSDQAFVGGYGMAERPCFPRRPISECSAERDACLADPGATQVACDTAFNLCIDGNAPAVTLECARPLIYAAHRKTEFMLRMTVEQVAVSTEELIGEGAAPGDTPFTCVTAQELEAGKEGGVLCEHRLVGIDQFVATAVDSAQSVSGGFGDIAFSRDGNSLYVVRNSVGGLLRVDTSLGDNNDTRDTPAAQVEVCAQPSAMVILDDGVSELAAISCYRPGTVYIVDLGAFRVVEQVFVGAGPHQMVFDAPREYLYVANTLDATVSVVDLGRTRATRYTEVARIGIQEPYSG